jgi:hypothetical protein
MVEWMCKLSIKLQKLLQEEHEQLEDGVSINLLSMGGILQGIQPDCQKWWSIMPRKQMHLMQMLCSLCHAHITTNSMHSPTAERLQPFRMNHKAVNTQLLHFSCSHPLKLLE